MANRKHIEVLVKGIGVWNDSQVRKAEKHHSNLSGANFTCETMNISHNGYPVMKKILIVITILLCSFSISATDKQTEKVKKMTNDDAGKHVTIPNVRITEYPQQVFIHPDFVETISFSPDGSLLAAGLRDKTARIWDVKTGKIIMTLSGHSRSVFSVSFSPDSTRLATGSGDNTARVWDLKSGEAIMTLSGHSGSIFSVSFSPDGTLLATGSLDKTARIWDVKTGKTVMTKDSRHPICLN